MSEGPFDSGAPGVLEGEPIGLAAAAEQLAPEAQAAERASAEAQAAPAPEAARTFTPGIFRPALRVTWRMVGERFERAGADPLSPSEVDDLANVWSDALDHYLRIDSPLAGAALVTAAVFVPRTFQLRRRKKDANAQGKTPGQLATEPRWVEEVFDEELGKWVAVQSPNAN